MFEIYLITNQINEKIYVGQAIYGIKVRWKSHVAAFKSRERTRLYNAFRKYGIKNFSISLLATAKSLEELDQLEIKWISLLHSKDPEVGYNMSDGGRGAKGLKHGPNAKTREKGKHSGKRNGRYREDISTEEIVRLYQEGQSSLEIASKLGVNKTVVLKRLREAGEVRRGLGEAAKKRCSIPANTSSFRQDVSTEEIVRLFEEGLNYTEIGIKVGVTSACVADRLGKKGLSRPPKRCNLNLDKVAEMYLSGDSVPTLADFFGVSMSSVYLALENLGISRRKGSSRPKLADRIEKRCCCCKIIFPLEDFHKDKTTTDGREPICKECRRKKYAKLHPPKKAIAPELGSETEQTLGPSISLPDEDSSLLLSHISSSPEELRLLEPPSLTDSFDPATGDILVPVA